MADVSNPACPLVRCDPILCAQPRCPVRRGATVDRTFVKIEQLIRPMRGRTGAWLVKASNNAHYVAKWAEPEGMRGLIAEMFGGTVLRHLRIKAPPFAILHADADVLRQREQYLHQLGVRDKRDIRPGLHYGSLVEPNLDRQSVYDLLPSSFYRTLGNRADFAGALLVDKLLNNQDCRQSVFYRTQIGGPLLVEMIDHGMSLGGDRWEFQDGPLMGLHRDRVAYDDVLGWHDLDPLLEAIQGLDPGLIHKVIDQIPLEWLGAGLGKPDVNRVGDLVLRRRTRVRALVQAILDVTDVVVFRNWGHAEETREAPPRKLAERAVSTSMPAVANR